MIIMPPMTDERPGTVRPSRYEVFLTGLRRPLVDTSPWPAGPVCRSQIRRTAAETHEFLHRSVQYVAARGVHRYLALGQGEPSHRILREVVHRVDPWASPAVVRTDATVLAVRAGCPGAGTADGLQLLLTCPLGEQLLGNRLGPRRPEGEADPDDPLAAGPVAVFLLGVLPHVVDDLVARDLVTRLIDWLSPGSFIVISHVTGDYPSAGLRAVVGAYERAAVPIRLRSRIEVEQLLVGLDLVEPGVDLISAWRREPAQASAAPPEEAPCWGAVGRVAERDVSSRTAECPPSPS